MRIDKYGLYPLIDQTVFYSTHCRRSMERCSMSFPKISVVVTMYKEGRLVGETIESILSQTFQDLEIILVDNNSDPETLQNATMYANKYPQKMRIVKETVQGIPSARNRGIKESRGEYIVFHDADDLSYPNRLESQYLILKDRPDLSVVGSWFDSISFENKIIERNISETRPNFWLESERIFNLLYQDPSFKKKRKTIKFPLISTCFFRRETVVSVGMFEEKLNPRFFEENEFLLRMFLMGDVQIIPIALLSYRMHSQNGSKVIRNQMDWIGKVRQLNTFFDIVKEKHNRNSHSEAVFKKLRAYWLNYISISFLQYESGTILGRIALWRSFKENPRDWKTLRLLLKSILPKNLHPKLFWFDSLIREPLPDGANETFVRSIFS